MPTNTNAMWYENALDQEYQFRKKMQKRIALKFAKIKQKIEEVNESEKLILQMYQQSHLYQNLKTSVADFEVRLMNEAQQAPKGDFSALYAAQKLDISIEDAFNEKKSLSDKKQSIQDFQDYARNTTLSTLTKVSIGAVIGAVAAAAIWVAVAVATGGLSAIGSSLFIPLVFVALGALTGADAGLKASKDHNSDRGQHVSDDLRGLVGVRNTLFNNRRVPAEAQLAHYPETVKFGMTARS